MMVFMRPQLTSSLLVALSLSACCAAPSSTSTEKPQSSAASVPTSATHASLPPEPPPPVADLAGEVPGLEAKLAADKAYGAVWTAPRADLDAFLTQVSELFSAGQSPKPVGDYLRKRNLEDAAVKLYLVVSRTNAFPADFTAKLRAHLGAIKAEPHLGVFASSATLEAPHDYSALAAWMNGDDAGYLRELIAAKTSGALRWQPRSTSPATRPWLAYQPEALARLALLGAAQATDCPADQYEPFQRVDPRTGTMGALGCQPKLPSATAEKRSALLAPATAADGWMRKAKTVARWPFSVDFGWVECRPVAHQGIAEPTPEVVFHAGGRTYGVNGFANGTKTYDDLGRILLDDPSSPPKGKPFKMDVSEVIKVGLSLCGT